MRVLRTLGKLDVFQPLVDEEQLSPSEYYELVQSNAAKHQRQRAVGRLNNTNKEESEPTEQREPSNSLEWPSREGGGQSQW